MLKRYNNLIYFKASEIIKNSNIKNIQFVQDLDKAAKLSVEYSRV